MQEEQQGNKSAPKKPPSTDPNRDKTVGVKVPHALYVKLVRVKESRGFPSIKATILYAAERGLAAMGEK